MINCIVVDDEKYALELIKTYISEIPFLNCLNYLSNPYDVLDIISKENIDLIITDIEMDGINGIQLLNCINNVPLRIICSAHDKYAMDGYELDVIDYLLKPVSFDRFLKAVVKAQEIYHHKHTKTNSYNTEIQANKCIFIKSDYKTIKIELNELLFIEGMKDYVKLYTPNKTYTSLMSLKTAEKLLPPDQFIRVHRSYIISINKIDTIEKSRVVIRDKAIPVSLAFRNNFEIIINRLK